ncbi:hypothetical protein ACIBI8_29550 [Streptomyces sp. NPDC050529]|uniref:hypothetical protein n=1 Tax=unclassified Streptomyces TaxID=2593676 RepID=UPI002DDABA66|nr:hypothetical protein [Streptomyces sp. NBC_01022]WRZ84375.1 hypothetical protein OG316_31010 [Streptomyces sp. NBC_01022]
MKFLDVAAHSWRINDSGEVEGEAGAGTYLVEFAQPELGAGQPVGVKGPASLLVGIFST